MKMNNVYRIPRVGDMVYISGSYFKVLKVRCDAFYISPKSGYGTDYTGLCPFPKQEYPIKYRCRKDRLNETYYA